MMNGTYQIDKEALASLVRNERAKRELSQAEMGEPINVPQNWVSRLELCKLDIDYEFNRERIMMLAGHFGFEVPLVNGEQIVLASRETLPAVVEQPAAPVVPVVPVPAADPELEALRICSEALDRLIDKPACTRIVYYLRHRYGLPPKFDDSSK